MEEGRRVFAAVPGNRKWFKEFPAVGRESYLSRFPRDWKATVESFLKRVEDRASDR